MTLEHLFTPTKIGEVTVKNRIVSPPHGTYLAADGLVTDQQLDYYEALARGGVGLIVAGSWAVWPRTQPNGLTNAAVDPRAVPGHKRLAAIVHDHDTHIFAQLHESGRQGNPGAHRRPLLAPSPLADPVVREIPKEMDVEEIAELRAHFVRSAVAMRSAGWDGVEVFAAQGYGLAQFLSPQMNRRTDAYGGDLAGRSRLLREIVRDVRAATGPAFPVGVRINGSDLVEGGTTIKDACELAAMLTASGDVDYLSVSGASNETYPLWIADMGHPTGLFVPLARRVREATTLPVLVTTRIADPQTAEAVLADGSADLVGMGRALIADPDLPRKAHSGAVGKIRPCVAANQGCIGRIAEGKSIRCTVNPDIGAVVPTTPDPATEGSRVVVVGAGPAGLEAATAAAAAGHEVTLLESGAAVGGQLALAALVASRAELGRLVGFYERELVRLEVDLRLANPATAADVASLRPNLVVLATGSEPVRSGYSSHRPHRQSIPGHDLPHVLTAHEVLTWAPDLGTRVVVVDDDPHGQATTVAEHLAREHEVTLICRSPSVGAWAGRANQDSVYRRLQQAEVDIRSATWVEEIEPLFVRCYPTHAPGSTRILPADSVVLATGNRVVDGLFEPLRAALSAVPIVRAGDCLAPRLLDQAVWEGRQAVVTGAPAPQVGR